MAKKKKKINAIQYKTKQEKSKIHREPKNEVKTDTHTDKQAPKLTSALKFLLNPKDLKFLL